MVINKLFKNAIKYCSKVCKTVTPFSIITCVKLHLFYKNRKDDSVQENFAEIIDVKHIFPVKK